MRFRKAKKRIKMHLRTKGEQKAFVDGVEHGFNVFCRKLEYEETIEDAKKQMGILIDALKGLIGGSDNRKKEDKPHGS